MIRRLPGVFAAGEMLDWEAPTGGYLLQASFATGAAAGRGALKWLEIVGWAERSVPIIASVAKLRAACEHGRFVAAPSNDDGATAASPAPRPAACR